MTRDRRCAYCERSITRGTNQAQRRFCDHACRQAAYRRRQLGLPENAPRQKKPWWELDRPRELRRRVG